MTPAKQDGVILLVEDPLIRSFLKTVLGRKGHKVAEAEIYGALTMLESRQVPVSVLITNQPRYFLAYADELRVLYIAAAPDPELAARFPHCRTLRKPFVPQELLSVVEELRSLAPA